MTDDCDNTTTLVQTITVVDTTAPTFTVPADLTIECDVDPNDLTITGDVTDEADNCSTDLDATYTDSVTAGSCANASMITRTWTLSMIVIIQQHLFRPLLLLIHGTNLYSAC